MFVYAAEVAQTIRDAARFGVDATLDEVRWNDIVSRVFGRIDPTRDGRRELPPLVTATSPCTTPTPDSAARSPTAGTRCAPRQATSSPPTRWSSPRVPARNVPDAIRECGVEYYTSDTIMRIGELPEHLVIVGGGFIAAEFAHVFSALGSRVSLVIRGGTLLRHCDDTICERFTDIASKKWEIHNHCNVTGASQDAKGVTLTMDNGATLHADTVLVATGRIPNADLLDAELAGVEVADGSIVVDEYQRTTARGIFALGDVSSDYQLKHVANHESRTVRENLLLDWDDTDSLKQTDHRYVPSAVFTDPQIAMVGLTENQARAKGLNVVSKVQDFGDVAYGWAMEDTTGIAKIIVDDDSGLILGAHIMGHQASSLIQPIIQAMSFGLGAQDMARGQYWIHPALPEVIENALLALCGEPPWPPARRH